LFSETPVELDRYVTDLTAQVSPTLA
jgi:hypothetical protein